MKNIKEYIIEKFKITKDTASLTGYEDDLNDLLLHFEFDSLYDYHIFGKIEHCMNKEDEEEIRTKLLDFLQRNDCHKETAKYYTNRGRKFNNKKIERDYKKDNAAWMGKDFLIGYGEKTYLFSGDDITDYLEEIET